MKTPELKEREEDMRICVGIALSSVNVSKLNILMHLQHHHPDKKKDTVGFLKNEQRHANATVFIAVTLRQLFWPNFVIIMYDLVKQWLKNDTIRC